MQRPRPSKAKKHNAIQGRARRSNAKQINENQGSGSEALQSKAVLITRRSPLQVIPRKAEYQIQSNAEQRNAKEKHCKATRCKAMQCKALLPKVHPYCKLRVGVKLGGKTVGETIKEQIGENCAHLSKGTGGTGRSRGTLEEPVGPE